MSCGECFSVTRLTSDISYSILDVMKRMREIRQAEAQAMLAKVIANPPNRSTPAPTTQPNCVQPPHIVTSTAQASAPTSQPPTNISKPRQVKKESGGSPYPNTPENPRSTATPVPHPVVNQLQTQQPIRSPPVHARSPAPPNTSYQPHPASTPMTASSPAQRGYTQSPRPPSSQAHPQSSPLASGSQLPTPDHRANPGGVHFIQVAPGAQSKPSTPQLSYSAQVPLPPQQATTQPHPQQAPQPPAPSQTQVVHPNLNMQYLAQIHQLQRMSQAAQAQAQAHAQAQTQVQAQSHLPTQMSQPAQHPTMPAQYNFAPFRPMNAQGNPHQQVATHIPPNQQQNMGAQGQVMDGQQQMMAQYVYGYPVGYGMAAGGRLQAQYAAAWAASGMGRVPNGQTPGMQPGHPQMPVAQGKAAPAGVQGR